MEQPFGQGDTNVVVLMIYLGIIVVGLTVFICYMLTLQKALSRVSPRNRLMEPGQVWLNLIPCFNIVWMFITVSRVSDSLKHEFTDLDLDDRSDYGKTIGLLYLAFNFGGIIPILGIVLGIASLVMFIVYWVKIAGYSGQLAQIDQDDRDLDDGNDRDDAPYRRDGRRGDPDDRIR